MNNVIDIEKLMEIGFSVSSLKESVDRSAYSYSLKFNGKKVAFVSNSSRGGFTVAEWEGISPNGSSIKGTLPSTVRAVKMAMEAFSVFVDESDDISINGDIHHMDDGLVLEALAEEARLIKKCKTKSLFRTAKGKEYALDAKYSPQIFAWIQAHFPSSVVHNERLKASL